MSHHFPWGLYIITLTSIDRVSFFNLQQSTTSIKPTTTQAISTLSRIMNPQPRFSVNAMYSREWKVWLPAANFRFASILQTGGNKKFQPSTEDCSNVCIMFPLGDDEAAVAMLVSNYSVLQLYLRRLSDSPVRNTFSKKKVPLTLHTWGWIINPTRGSNASRLVFLCFPEKRFS